MPDLITTPKGTGDLAGSLGVDRIKRSVADEIFFVEADAMPLTAMVRRARKITISAIKREWGEDELYPETFLSAAAGQTTTNLRLDTGLGVTVHVGDILWDPSDRESARVLSIATDDVTTTTKASAWNVTVDVLRLGNAMSQGSSTPSLKQTVEVFRNNFIQRMRKPFSLTIEAENTAMYGEDEKALSKREKLIEIMREMEMTNLLSEVAIAGTQVQGGTASIAMGVAGFLEANAPAALKVDHAASALTKDELNVFIRSAFVNRGDSQAATKVLFAAPAIIEDIQAFSEVSGAQRFGATSTKFGVKVAMWQTSFGDISVVPHPMLATRGSTNTNQNQAFMLDMSQVAQVVQSNLDLQYTEFSKRQTTGEEVVEGAWSISQCIQIKGSTGLHGYFYNVND